MASNPIQDVPKDSPFRCEKCGECTELRFNDVAPIRWGEWLCYPCTQQIILDSRARGFFTSFG